MQNVNVAMAKQGIKADPQKLILQKLFSVEHLGEALEKNPKDTDKKRVQRETKFHKILSAQRTEIKSNKFMRTNTDSTYTTKPNK